MLYLDKVSYYRIWFFVLLDILELLQQMIQKNVHAQQKG